MTTEGYIELDPARYGEAGWNLPTLRFWLDLDLPNKKK